MKKLLVIGCVFALAACGSDEPAPAATAAVVDESNEAVEADIAANNVDAKTTSGEVVNLASVQAAFEKDCAEADVVNAICKPTDNPTQFACDYALKGDSMFDLKQVVIAEDGDSFKFVDVPNHCTSQ